MWYVPPPRVLEHFVARDESPTGWDQMQNVNLQTEPGRFMATFVRTGSYNNCVIKVHGKQYFNGYENTEEELDNVPLKSLQSTSVTNVPPSSTQLTSVTTELQGKLNRLASVPGRGMADV